MLVPLKDADEEQSISANKLNSIDKGIKPIETKLFLSNAALFFNARGKVLDNRNRNLEPELEPELELVPRPKYRKVLDNRVKIFRWNCKLRKKTNEEIFRNYFKCQNPPSLVKDLFKGGKNKNDKVNF